MGVGLMGHGIARNVLRAGHPLTLLDHPGNQPVDDLLAAGATTVTTPAKMAQSVQVVILCVPGSPQVEDILYGADGLLAHMQPGTVIIDCSTALPSSTVKIARDVSNAGCHFLDAAMTRTPKEAAEGRLNLIVGGDKVVFERYKPLLQSYAENITFVGPAGSGHRMKLVHNFVSLGFAAVLAEAASCAELADIAPETLLDILATGGGGGVVLDRLRPYIEARDPSGFRFSMANAMKDMTYYATMADESGACHVTADAVRDAYTHGNAQRPQGIVPELIDVLLADAKSAQQP